MTGRTVLFGLLLVVAAAAAVLSFAALRDLAIVCGFAAQLAWLLPVIVDAGAASGSLVWLGGWAGGAAQRFARLLALGLLGLSVAANALGHGLAAYGLAPPWWVVVAVSAVAPTVLGAVVHLAVLVGRVDSLAEAEPTELEGEPAEPPDEHDWWETAPSVADGAEDRASELITAGVGRRRLSRELGVTEYQARQLLDRARNGTTQEESTP